jgi:hypothetical protein
LSKLRKLMESDFAEKDDMQICICKAAVHASRSNNPNESFKAVNGQVYPDISKAFSAFSGVRSCQRCKGNKQGVSTDTSIPFHVRWCNVLC